MKSTYFASLLICALLTVSCSKQETVFERYNLETGAWILHQIDGQPVEENNLFIYHFEDGRFAFASRVEDGLGGNTWETTPSVLYDFDGTDARLFYASGPMELTVKNLDYASLVCDCQWLHQTFSFYHAPMDYSRAIMGIWQGRNTTPNTEYPETARWGFYPDGRYSYSQLLDDGTWSEPQSNTYALYGDLLVCIFKITPTSENRCEVWKIATDNGVDMTWTAIRDGAPNSVQMSKL